MDVTNFLAGIGAGISLCALVFMVWIERTFGRWW